MTWVSVWQIGPVLGVTLEDLLLVNQGDGLPSRAVVTFHSVRSRTEFWHRYQGKSLVNEGICDQGKRLKMRDVVPWNKRHSTGSRSRSQYRHRHRADADHGDHPDVIGNDKWRPWHDEPHCNHRSGSLRRGGRSSVSALDHRPESRIPLQTAYVDRASCDDQRTHRASPAPTPQPALGYSR